jgi:hypothetical protein
MRWAHSFGQAISEENASAPGDAQLFTYFTNQGRLGVVADLPHTLTKN